MFGNSWFKKEKPFLGFAGFGGGATGLGFAGGAAGASPGINATGGTIRDWEDSPVDPTYKYRTHVFTTPGTFVISAVPGDQPSVVDYLVVGAGGAGGNDIGAGWGGGGGAGSLRTTVGNNGGGQSLDGSLTGVVHTHPVTIGNGGDCPGPTSIPGNGGTSYLDWKGPAPTTIYCGGGGRGGSNEPVPAGQQGGDGDGPSPSFAGCGGGGGKSPTNAGGAGDSGTYGFNGSGAGWQNDIYTGGGGGAGGTGFGGPRGDGGIGLNVDIAGPGSPWGSPATAPWTTGAPSNTRWFGGGGSGSGPETGVGGKGGGGSGYGPNTEPTATHAAWDGQENTGGGGGGGRGGFNGGVGGSGIVMVRYKVAPDQPGGPA